MVVYMIVSKPPYELPMQTFDSLQDMAKSVGLKPNHISSIMSRSRKSGGFCRYVRVDIGSPDDDPPIYKGDDNG